MALLTVHPISMTGDSKAYVAADAGLTDTFPNDGRTFLHIKNTNASGRTATVNSIRPCDQGVDHNIPIAIGATTGDEMAGPFDPARFNDPNTGLVSVTFDAVAGVTIAAIRLPA
jgi:hypothetical protein